MLMHLCSCEFLVLLISKSKIVMHQYVRTSISLEICCFAKTCKYTYVYMFFYIVHIHICTWTHICLILSSWIFGGFTSPNTGTDVYIDTLCLCLHTFTELCISILAYLHNAVSTCGLRNSSLSIITHVFLYIHTYV